MSKILADEYKKLAAHDLPDLWDRIEAGIDEKKVAAAPLTNNVPEKKIKVVNNRDFKVDNLKTIKLDPLSYQNRRRFAKRYGGLIAALFCVAIIIPVIFFNRGLGSFTSYDSNSNNEAAYPGTESYATSPSQSETAIEAVPAPAAEMPYFDDMTVSEESGMEEVNEMLKNADSSAAENRALEIFDVTIVIIDDMLQNEVVYYKATVIADESETLPIETEIYLRYHENVSGFDFAFDEPYRVDLVSDDEEGLYYTIIAVW
ncbi:MAG: hypothetical protein FWC09_11245 [Lachnospiraceae bacterium]|nr:hypothetical protein [Lachnospiraceae bacterium]